MRIVNAGAIRRDRSMGCLEDCTFDSRAVAEKTVTEKVTQSYGPSNDGYRPGGRRTKRVRKTKATGSTKVFSALDGTLLAQIKGYAENHTRLAEAVPPKSDAVGEHWVKKDRKHVKKNKKQKAANEVEARDIPHDQEGFLEISPKNYIAVNFDLPSKDAIGVVDGVKSKTVGDGNDEAPQEYYHVIKGTTAHKKVKLCTEIDDDILDAIYESLKAGGDSITIQSFIETVSKHAPFDEKKWCRLWASHALRRLDDGFTRWDVDISGGEVYSR